MIFYLLLCLGFIHFLCDYTWLSTPQMLKAKSIGKPIWPIAVHALFHSSLMLIALSFFDVKNLGWLFILQFVSHLIIDILKGKLNVWFPKVANPTNKIHWVVFGFDQFLHFAVIVIMVKLAFFN